MSYNLTVIGQSMEAADEQGEGFAGILPELHGMRDFGKLLQSVMGSGLDLGGYGTLKASSGTSLEVTASGGSIHVEATPPLSLKLRKWGVSKTGALKSISLSDTKLLLVSDGLPDLSFDVVS